MFRNVTAVHEAVVHQQQQSNGSSHHENLHLIKDHQSDDIAHEYINSKNHWTHERQQLIEQLKHLDQHQDHSHEIQRIENLIECLDELIQTGDLTKYYQFSIEQTKKSADDRLIRLPKHLSKTHLSNPFKRISSEILHLQTQVFFGSFE